MSARPAIGVSTVFFYFNSKTKTNVWLSCPQFGKSFAVTPYLGGAWDEKILLEIHTKASIFLS